MTAETSLARWARERPETPFVFFRGRRGQFEWLSFREVGDPEPDSSLERRMLPREIAELVEALRAGLVADGAAASPGLGAPAKGQRDIAISWRPLDDPAERRAVAWALAHGAALLVERRDRFPADLAVWARPTVVWGPIGDLERFLDELARDAPRLRRTRWLRQRLLRLRALLVEGAATASELARIRAHLRALDPETDPEIVLAAG